MSRGWTDKDWRPRRQPQPSPMKSISGNATTLPDPHVNKPLEPEDIENLSPLNQPKADHNSMANSSFSVCDMSTQSMVGMPEPDSQASSQPAKKERKIKIREVKQETQTVKTRLDSPTGKKMKRKNNSSAEPTMTFHSKAATNEIYDMFNQPLHKPEIAKDDTLSGDDADFTEDDGYSTAGESTGTGRVSAPSSEFGDDTLASIRRGQPQLEIQSQSDSLSPWSEFTASKHVPRLSSTHFAVDQDKPLTARIQRQHKRQEMSEDMTENVDSSSQNQTQTSGLSGSYDTQAIAAIAGGKFDEMDTKAIAMLAGDREVDVAVDDAVVAGDVDEVDHKQDILTAADLSAPATGRQQAFVIYDDEPLTTPVDNAFPEQFEIQHEPRYVPLPPVDYEPTPARSYRDADLVAQNKLPFMTPIAERTESSLAPSTVFNEPGYFDSKTPSRSKYDSPSKIGVDNLLLSSPHQDVATPTSSSPAKRKYNEPGTSEDEVITSSPQKKKIVNRLDLDSSSPAASKTDDFVFKTPALPSKSQTTRSPLTKVSKGPVILDLQCNPCDEAVRSQILSSVYPPLSSQKGFSDHSSVSSGRYPILKSFADKQAKAKARSSPRKGQNEKTLTKAVPPILKFNGATRVYAVKRELGQGAFAPVYLVDSHDPEEVQEADENDKENKTPPAFDIANAPREALEALKAECPPGTLVWEFHILRTVKQRVGQAARTMQSVILAHECHLYRDEAFIVLQYSPQGTLLDLINAARNETVKAGKPAEGLDEVVAMWLAVELLRLLEDLHRIGILHGDLKGDNCLVRFDTSEELVTPYSPDGNYGWNSRGLKLIDFGRGIDTRMFKSNAQFIADWPSCSQDCAEIREARPWKWQIDYHGAAGVIHSLLFGKYIDTVPTIASSLGPGQKKDWKLKESFKRYWDKDIWGDLFTTLLNPGSVIDEEEMPIQENLKRVRLRMERWLIEEGERGGRDLRASLRRMERLVCK